MAQRHRAAPCRLTNDIIDRTECPLTENPSLGRLCGVDGTRELVLGDTSYVVAYRVSQTIEILAVMHGAQQWPEKFD